MRTLLEKAKELVKAMKGMVEVQERREKVSSDSLQPGAVIEGKNNRYIVLCQMNGETMVISKDLMMKDVQFDQSSTDYPKSSLCKMIENDILPVFEADFGAENIVEHVVNLATVDMQNVYGTYMCKVRLLTFDEAREFNALLSDDTLPDWYWTCTPWSTEERGWSRFVAVVSPAGVINSFIYNRHNGVRPICILKSNIFASKGE